jgi:hypothetical protein
VPPFTYRSPSSAGLGVSSLVSYPDILPIIAKDQEMVGVEFKKHLIKVPGVASKFWDLLPLCDPKFLFGGFDSRMWVF